VTCIDIESIIRLRLAPPGERYQRVAQRASAMAFAADLAEACPGTGARVYLGGERAAGWIVTLGDDREAAKAAGADRLLWHCKGDAE
jgi:hypothetical protein